MKKHPISGSVGVGKREVG
jgi:hypothetical protein